MFIADSNNHRIRKVNAMGIITTVAGTGTAGSVGDGGAAISAQLNQPYGVAFDSVGTMYIADSGNNRIRMVTSGVITTVAGTGSSTATLGDGAATSAKLSSPSGVAVDSVGNIIIADTDYSRIRKVTKSTGVITTVAGTTASGSTGDGGAATSAKLSSPRGVAIGSDGTIFIADSGNHRIRKVTSGVITTVAGTSSAGFGGDGGAATSALLNYPYGVAVGSEGNMFIAEYANNCIRKVTSGVITTVAGTTASGFTGDGGAATSAKLNSPNGVAVGSDGNIFIADTSSSRIRKLYTGYHAPVLPCNTSYSSLITHHSSLIPKSSSL